MKEHYEATGDYDVEVLSQLDMAYVEVFVEASGSLIEFLEYIHELGFSELKIGAIMMLEPVIEFFATPDEIDVRGLLE